MPVQQLQCQLCRVGAQHVLELTRDLSRECLELRLNHTAIQRVDSYRYRSVWEAFDATWTTEQGLLGVELLIRDPALLANYRQNRGPGYDPERRAADDGRLLGPAALPASLTRAPQDPGGGFASLLGMRVMIDPDLPSNTMYFVDQHGQAQERITGVADEYRDAIIRRDGTVTNNPPPPGDVLDMETLQRAYRRLRDASLEAVQIVVSPEVHRQLTRLYTDPVTGERLPRPLARPAPPSQSRIAQDPGSDDPLEDQDADRQ